MLRTRILAVSLALLALASCDLDKEAELRSTLTQQLYVLETVHFASKSTCTAAVYTLALSEFRKGYAGATSVKTALELIAQGKAVHFIMPGQSPNAISEQVMTGDLPSGLGLMSAAVGPAENCMPEPVARGYFRVLMSPETDLVYLPQDNSILLLYRPEKLAFYLRGNV